MFDVPFKDMDRDPDGWLAFYNSQKCEIPRTPEINNIYDAKQEAARIMKVRPNQQYMIAIAAAYND